MSSSARKEHVRKMERGIYTGARGLLFIGDYNLKPVWQMFSIDSKVNLPCDNDFLYQLFQ